MSRAVKVRLIHWLEQRRVERSAEFYSEISFLDASAYIPYPLFLLDSIFDNYSFNQAG